MLNKKACDGCGKIFNEDELEIIGGDVFCVDCINMFDPTVCDGCGYAYAYSDMYERGGDILCEICEAGEDMDEEDEV